MGNYRFNSSYFIILGLTILDDLFWISLERVNRERISKRFTLAWKQLATEVTILSSRQRFRCSIAYAAAFFDRLFLVNVRGNRRIRSYRFRILLRGRRDGIRFLREGGSIVLFAGSRDREIAACQRDMERTTRTTKKEERLLLTIIATTRLQSRLVFSVGSGDNVSFAERAVHGQLPAGCMYVHISARGFSPRSSLSPSNPRLETHLEGHPGRATSGCGSTRLPSD